MSGQSATADLETSPVPAQHNTHRHNLLIVSDLHIGEGLEADGKLNRNEDFLYDKEFAHFLIYHQRKREKAHSPGNRPWRLILNGDVVDFLQVTEVPTQTEAELVQEVGDFLGQPNIDNLQKALDELTAVAGSPQYNSVERARLVAEVQVFILYKENLSSDKLPYDIRRWGLGSTSEENVWRLHRIFQGHPVFFQGLAWFLAMGNEIVIQTGNHDIEIFWPKVRQAFRDIINLAHGQLTSENWRLLLAAFGYEYDLQAPHLIPNDQFSETVASKLAFTHWIYYEPDVAYIEHGCQYETANSWPTYLNPKYVPINPPKEGEGEQSHLLWPWGSLIVRYIYNRIEQVHPFVDQIKPITAYLTWAFSRDLLRSIWLLLISIPGMLRVGHQILNRGVIEGWFGNTFSITGIFTMAMRGMLMWRDWLRNSPSDSPLLPSERWKQVRREDQARQIRLASQIGSMYKDPVQVEKNVLDAPVKKKDLIQIERDSVRVKEEAKKQKEKSVSFKLQIQQQLLALAIWLGMVTAVFLLARGVVGWEWKIAANSFRCEETAVLCQLLPDFMTKSVFGFSEGISAKIFNALLLVLTICVIYVSAKERALLEQIEPENDKVPIKHYLGMILIIVFYLILGTKVFYTLSTFFTSTGPKSINWLIFGAIFSLILVTVKPKGEWQWATPYFRGLFSFGVLLSIIFGVIGLLSTIIISEPTPTSFTLWATGWSLLAIWRLKGQTNSINSQFLKWLLILAIAVGGAIFGLFILYVSIIYSQESLNLPDLSPFAVWVVGWGFLGLWLLESKDNPFREKADIQGWLKDWLGDDYLWLSATLYSSLTFIVEIGLILLLVSGAAIIFDLQPPFLPQNFPDDSSALLRALFTAVLFITVGAGGNWLVTVMQTENFPERVKVWHRDHTWQLDILLGLGFLGLICWTFWFLFGKSIFSDPSIGGGAAAVSFFLYRFSSEKLKNKNHYKLIQHQLNGKWLLILGLLSLLWAGVIMIQTMSGVTTLLIASPKWPWCAGTVLLGLWLLLGGKEDSETRAHLRLVNSVSWLFMLINLVFLLIILFGELAGQPIDVLTRLRKIGESLSALITDNFSGIKILPKMKELLNSDIKKALNPVGSKINPAISKHLAGTLIITLTFVGIVGQWFLQKLLILVTNNPACSSLSAEAQIWRIIKIAERLQQSFIRRFARIAIIALSMIFSTGLLVGVYFTFKFINTGNSPFGILGALLAIVSWIGRRVLPLIPSNVTPDGGYLLEAATEIRSILHRGENDKTDMQYVPYFLFGHDHHPTYEELKKPGQDSNYPVKQWYVNTGAWVQSYSGDVRLRREDEDQSIFVEIIVDDVLAAKSLPPTLRRWDSKLGMPMPLNRLISPFEESLPKRIIKVLLRLIGIDDVPYTELK